MDRHRIPAWFFCDHSYDLLHSARELLQQLNNCSRKAVQCGVSVFTESEMRIFFLVTSKMGFLL